MRKFSEDRALVEDQAAAESSRASAQLLSELLAAVEAGNDSKVAELISKDADLVNEAGEGKWTALHLAAQKGHTAVVEYLLKQGADTEARDTEGYTALHWAAFCGHTEIVDYLLDRGANREAKNKWGYTALHFAAQAGRLEIANYLIEERGVDISARDNQDNTALHLAARAGRLDVLKSLIEVGADVESLEEAGKTALALAEENQQREIISVLEEWKMLALK